MSNDNHNYGKGELIVLGEGGVDLQGSEIDPMIYLGKRQHGVHYSEAKRLVCMERGRKCSQVTEVATCESW